MTGPTGEDREMRAIVRSWLSADDGPTADRNRQIGRIMGRVDETRQDGLPRLPAWFGRHTLSKGRNVAPAAFAAMAVVALVTTGVLFGLFRPTDPAPGPAVIASASPSPQAPSMDPADEALFERLSNLWGTDAVDVSEAMDVYAPDAVHTALWTDKVQRFAGSNAIANRIMVSEKVEVDGPAGWTRLPDAESGAHRYLAVTERVGDMPCVVWVEQDRITRHDCILPMAEAGEWPFTAGTPPEGVRREDLAELMTTGWSGDEAVIEQVASPDIIHFVAFDDHAVRHKGIEEYVTVNGASRGLAGPIAIAPAQDLAAPEGELRWTNYSDVAGGTLCTFWARGDKVIRHDCIVPARTTNNPPPGATGT